MNKDVGFFYLKPKSVTAFVTGFRVADPVEDDLNPTDKKTESGSDLLKNNPDLDTM